MASWSQAAGDATIPHWCLFPPLKQRSLETPGKPTQHILFLPMFLHMSYCLRHFDPPECKIPLPGLLSSSLPATRLHYSGLGDPKGATCRNQLCAVSALQGSMRSRFPPPPLLRAWPCSMIRRCSCTLCSSAQRLDWIWTGLLRQSFVRLHLNPNCCLALCFMSEKCNKAVISRFN